MKARILRVLAALIGACTKPTPTRFTTGGDDVAAEPGRTCCWSFDDTTVGSLPADYVSVLGDWTLENDSAAPSAPNVLRQTGAFKNPDFPRVLVKGLTFTDLTLRVRCRAEKGDIDRACGLVFRAKDSDNYYLTRANALEDNVRLYRIVNGDRQQLAGADLKVTSGEWHTHGGRREVPGSQRVPGCSHHRVRRAGTRAAAFVARGACDRACDRP